MGSEGVEVVVEDVEAFLKRCEPSGDAAYAELRALLARLHDPKTRRQARVFLAELQSSSSSVDDDLFFRRYGFAIRVLNLHSHAFASSIDGAAAGQYVLLQQQYHHPLWVHQGHSNLYSIENNWMKKED